MAIKTLSQFKSRLSSGGARPNLFEVNCVFPTGITGVSWLPDAQEDFQFFCKATAMPASSIGVVDVPFRGRILKVAGDRTFEPWSVTVINDEDFNIRKSFEKWANGINNLVSGVGEVDPTKYMGSGEIRQLSRKVQGLGFAGDETTTDTAKTQQVAHTYKYKDIWPSEIGSIDLSYDSSDAIEEFTVTFQVEYITSTGVTDASEDSSTTQVDDSTSTNNTVNTGQTTGLL